MKRFLRISLCALSLVLLTACGAGITAPDDGELQDAWDRAWSDLEKEEYLPDDAKAHRYQILNGGGEELYTVTDETQVAALDGLLGNVGKERQENPVLEEEEIACVYVYRQEKTLLAGEDPQREREFEEVIRFTVCRDQDLITVQCLKGLEGLEPAGIRLEDFLTFTISVPAETMESLRNPAQFAGE